MDILKYPMEMVVFRADGVGLIACPFNKNHQFPPSKFGDHIWKCRREMEREWENARNQPPKVACKFNCEHMVFVQEKTYHEHNCADKRLGLALLATFGGGIPIATGSAAVGNVVVGSAKAGPAVVGAIAVGGGVSAVVARCVTVPFGVLDQTRDSTSTSYVRYTRKTRRQVCADQKSNGPVQLDPEVVEELEWNKQPKEKGFNWYERQHNPLTFSANYPPGSTKSERRKFDDDNTARLLYHFGHGIRVVEDNPVRQLTSILKNGVLKFGQPIRRLTFAEQDQCYYY